MAGGLRTDGSVAIEIEVEPGDVEIDMERFYAYSELEQYDEALALADDLVARLTSPEPARPLGVQLVAARFREDILLAAAADIEARSPPIEVANPD